MSESMTQTIRRSMSQVVEDQMKAAIPSRVGRYMTARQMALKSHWLSTDGMTANAGDGGVWKWSEHFHIWACVQGAR